MRKNLLAATGAVGLLTAALTGTTALAQCPGDLERLNAAIEAAAAQGEAVPQPRLEELRAMQAEAQRLHQNNDEAACSVLAQQALAMAGDSVMPQLALAGNLANTTVVNAEGEQMGNITDLIVDLGTGRVAYAIFSLGGFLGLGGDQFPVPWKAVRVESADRIVLPVERERLRAAPRFDRDLWPGVADRDWQAALYRYYGLEPPAWARTPVEAGAAAAVQPPEGLSREAAAAATQALLQQRLTELSRQIGDLGAQMNQLTEQVASEGSQRSARASETAERIQGLSQQIAALQNQVGGLDQQAVGEQIAGLQQEIDRLRQSLQADAGTQAAGAAPEGGSGQPSAPPAAAPPPQQQEPQQPQQ